MALPHCRPLRVGVCALVAVCAVAPWGTAQIGELPPPATSGPATSGPDELPSPASAPDPTDRPIVVDVRVDGHRDVKVEKIAALIKTRKDREYSEQQVREDITALHKSRMFVTVQSENVKVEGGVVVIFHVVERPTLQHVKYLGVRSMKIRRVEEEGGLKVGQPVDPYSVEEAKRKIEVLYASKGYNHVTVDVVEGNKPGDRGATFIVNEGQKQRVSDVEFVGNTIATDGRLKTQIESKRPLFFLFGGFVDREKIDGDVERLTNYYRSLGYFRARVSRDLEYNDQSNWLKLTFVIDEGPRYKIRNISFIGNETFETGDLAKALTTRSAANFDQVDLNKDLSAIQEIYGANGYVFADIQAEPRWLAHPDPLDMVDLVFVIKEGKQYRVGDVEVNITAYEYDRSDHLPSPTHTSHSTVLNRIADAGLRPGDIVDIRKIRMAERRLRASGLFRYEPARGIAPKILIQPGDKDKETELASGKKASSARGQSPDWQAPPLNDARDGSAVAVLHVREVPKARPPAVPWSTARSPIPQAGANRRPAAADQPRVVRGQNFDGSSPNPRPRNGFGQPQVGPAFDPAEGASVTVQDSGQPGSQPVFGGPPLPTAQAPSALGGGNAAQPLPDPAAGAESVPAGPLLPEGGYFNDNPPANLVINAQEGQTGRFSVGVAVNSEAGVFGQIILDEQNFDIFRPPTSWDDILYGQAFRGRGQRLRIEAVPGSEFQRYSASFQEPYLLDSNISLGLSGFFFDRRYLDWDEQRVGGSISFGYQLRPDLSATLSLRVEDVDVRNPRFPTPPEVAEVLGSNDLYSARVALAHDTRDHAFMATEGHLLELGFEQTIGSFDYPRGTVEARQYFMLHERPDRSGRHVLSLRGRAGLSGSHTPVYDNFFAGGFSTIRGFDFRGVGPVSLGSRVGGEFLLLGSAEYVFPLTADDVLRGVVFVDSGTVEPEFRLSSDTFRVAPGLGLRIAVPAMGDAPIAVDFAWAVNQVDSDDTQVFSFYLGLLR
ncbi:MAG: BamA/TamA family outer membrane protein [Planctomycetia bacterium]|nr:BamA/TamA family outer membrane protein [Planctomycetia bacterium]